MPTPLRLIFVGAACGLLGACTSSGGTSSASTASSPAAAVNTPSPGTARLATVNLAPASGSLVSGKLQLMPMGDGVHVVGEIGGLGSAGPRAIHIHEKGDCSAADASSAGGHFNPTASPHGKVGAPPHHGGDMDNLVADVEGVARVDVHASGVVLGGGGSTDVVGRAVVVHASPDDYRSQPAGNAGARVACGVIAVAP